jgi:Zn-finger nucleic acid-binding protein
VQDLDLKRIGKYRVENSESQRICPDCHIPLRTIDVGKGESFYIEQCTGCYGLFFDPNELEALMNQSVDEVYSIKLKQLDQLATRNYTKEKIVYRKCPICQTLMNRTNFGGRSGIIIDSCRDHGVWLDRGELSALIEWKKAGGEILKAEIESKQKQREVNRSSQKHEAYRTEIRNSNMNNRSCGDSWLESGLSALVKLIFRGF